MIDLFTDYDSREIAAIIVEDTDVAEESPVAVAPVVHTAPVAVVKTEEENRREFERAMTEFCDEEVERAKARIFGYVARIKERPTVHIPYKSESRPERAPEPISTFMANLLTRYGINPTGMTAIEGAVAYRNVPHHIKARVNVELRKNRLDKQRARL